MGAPGRERVDLNERARALEEAFYEAVPAEQRASVRAEHRGAPAGAALRRAAGVTDDDILGALAEAGVTADTMLPVALLPLIAVAWADGRVQERERRAILHGARAHGITAGSAAGALLEAWLERAPQQSLLEAWADYIAALDERLTARHRKQLMAALVARARGVAEAAGGFLGIGSVSAEEEEVLVRLEAAFKFPQQFLAIWREQR